MDETQHQSASPDAPLEGQAGLVAGLQRLIPTARQRLAILSPSLPASAYGQPEIVDLLRQFLLSSPRAQLRVLVASSQAVQKAHLLIELGRQLSSRVHFRQLTEDQAGIDEELVIADEASWLQRRPALQLQTAVYLQASLNARLQLRRYDPMWERAVPAREFYVLGI